MTMDINFSVGGAEGAPFAEHERIGAPRTIFRSDALGGWVVSSYEDVKNVISNAKLFSNEKTPLSEAFGPEAMLVDDTPRHHKVRNVWAKPASVSGVAGIAGDIERVFDEIFVPVAGRLHAGETVELVGIFEEFTSELITILMGIPSDRKQDFLLWNRVISDASVLPLDKNSPLFAKRAADKENVFAYLRTQVKDRRERLANGEELTDLISLMVAAEGRDGITEAIALDNLLNLLLGALDTSVRWMGNILMVLSRHPEILTAVRADRGLLLQTVEEVMRLESVVQLTMRIVRGDDVVVGGEHLKAGDFIYMLTGAANRDPEVFERAYEFDIYRKPKLHLGFGFGMHQCLGMNIARKEAIIMLNRLFDLVPSFEIAEHNYGETWMLWGPKSLKVRATGNGISHI
jgi:pimeloyl-[acyl-carrier protein] synthase